MPGESVEGSSHETSFRFQQKLNSLELGSIGGGLAGTCLYTTLEAPNHDVNVPNGDVIIGSSREENGIGGLKQGSHVIG